MNHNTNGRRDSSRLVTDPIPRGWAENFSQGLISVVIPTYNHAHFLVDAIESALAQNYPLVEIIVVDDGSTDNTPEIMAAYTDRVHYIRQANRGLSGARNTGILAARGEFIALLDADDFWQPTYLQVTQATLAADSGLGAVHTGMQFVNAQGNPLSQPGAGTTVPADQMYDRLLDGEFFAPSAVLVRRWALAAAGLFDLELRASEDWELWLRISHPYRFAGLPEALLNYRVHGNNMSADPAHMLHYQLLTLEKHFGHALPNRQQENPDHRRAFAAVAYFAAQGYYAQGNWQRGMHHLRQALEANSTLTESVAIFYELGCVNQPLGERGDPATLDLQKNADLVHTSLTQIFQAPDLAAELHAKKKIAFGHAYRALGTLAYNSGKRHLAQCYLWRALSWQPLWIAQKSFATILIKTLLTPQISTFVRALQTRTA